MENENLIGSEPFTLDRHGLSSTIDPKERKNVNGTGQGASHDVPWLKLSLVCWNDIGQDVYWTPGPFPS